MNKNDKFHGVDLEQNIANELNDDALDAVAGGSGSGQPRCPFCFKYMVKAPFEDGTYWMCPTRHYKVKI